MRILIHLTLRKTLTHLVSTTLLILVSTIAQTDVVVHVPPIGYSWPQYFSGTNCAIQWEVNTGQHKYHWIKHVTVQIGGETVYDHTYPDPDELPYNTSVSGTVRFDSTHFRNGIQLVVYVQATDSSGATGSGHNSAPVYNMAFVLGNETSEFSGWGIDEMQDVAAQTNAMNYETFDTHTRDKAQILSSIPVYTLFFIDTHGGGASFGDCFCTSTSFDRIITPDEVAPEVATKVVPPYDFVHIEACWSSGYHDPDPSMAQAFGLYGFNKCYMGWLHSILINSNNDAWNERFWASLAETYDVYSSALNAHAGGAKDGADGPNGQAIFCIHGDGDTKVHGLYGRPLGVWYQCY